MTARIPSFESVSLLDNRPASVDADDPHQPARRFVRHALRDLLGRQAREAETEGWVRQLSSGVSRATLATCLLNSGERREQWVTRMYWRFLKRAPTLEMLRYWSDQLSARRSQEEVLAGILSSPEYLALYGAKNEHFVRALFRDLVNHRPTSDEVDSWVGLLDSACASRTAVAYQFVIGDDYRRRMIREWYLQYLEREPDRDAIAYCLEQLRVGHSAERVQAEILATREYYARALSFAKAS